MFSLINLNHFAFALFQVKFISISHFNGKSFGFSNKLIRFLANTTIPIIKKILIIGNIVLYTRETIWIKQMSMNKLKTKQTRMWLSFIMLFMIYSSGRRKKNSNNKNGSRSLESINYSIYYTYVLHRTVL